MLSWSGRSNIVQESHLEGLVSPETSVLVAIVDLMLDATGLTRMLASTAQIHIRKTC